ncbi:MAG: hypothetical protein C4321_04605 [Chloroflexota bacterium]
MFADATTGAWVRAKVFAFQATRLTGAALNVTAGVRAHVRFSLRQSASQQAGQIRKAGGTGGNRRIREAACIVVLLMADGDRRVRADVAWQALGEGKSN